MFVSINEHNFNTIKSNKENDKNYSLHHVKVKVKLKLSQCLTMHHPMKTYGEWRY